MRPTVDLSALPPPSQEFMAAMANYHAAVVTHGRESRAACLAMAAALEAAPAALAESIAADARARGLLPPPSAHTSDGAPMYSAQDLADFYGVDVDEVVAQLGPPDTPAAPGYGPH